MKETGCGISFLSLLLAAQLAAAPAFAAPPAGKGPAGKGPKSESGIEAGLSLTLATAGISVEQARRLAVEGGHTGLSALPPGIAKNLGRGKPLPPGIAKKMVPSPMLARLPAQPGYEWRIYGADLVLVATATAIIADVLIGVFR